MTTDASVLPGAPAQDFREAIASRLGRPDADWRADLAEIGRLAERARWQSAEARAEEAAKLDAVAAAKSRSRAEWKAAYAAFEARGAAWLFGGFAVVVALMALDAPLWLVAGAVAAFGNGLLWSLCRLLACQLTTSDGAPAYFEPRTTTRLSLVRAYLEFPVRLAILVACGAAFAVLVVPVSLIGLQMTFTLIAMLIIGSIAVGSLSVIGPYLHAHDVPLATDVRPVP